MTIYQYCTPEWLEESAKRYEANPRFQKEFEKINVKIYFRVKSEPAWGIDEDILFGAVVEKGKLLKLGFVQEKEAKTESDFILAATPQGWKRLLRKETKFIPDVMLKKIAVEQGNFASLLKIAPHGDSFVDTLTQVELQFPDEMSPEELAKFRDKVKDLHKKIEG